MTLGTWHGYSQSYSIVSSQLEKHHSRACLNQAIMKACGSKLQCRSSHLTESIRTLCLVHLSTQVCYSIQQHSWLISGKSYPLDIKHYSNLFNECLGNFIDSRVFFSVASRALCFLSVAFFVGPVWNLRSVSIDVIETLTIALNRQDRFSSLC